jgi:hypothetical protein
MNSEQRTARSANAAADGRSDDKPRPNPPLAQSFPNRIHQDVAGFLVQFVVIAQAVIEKIALPIHAVLSGGELFPVLHRRFHSRVARKRNDRMQMIWHKQAQPAMPGGRSSDRPFIPNSDSPTE